MSKNEREEARDDAPLDADAFWHFSLDIYGRDGVKDACLALQDGHSADVNLLLLILWLDRKQRQLTGQELEALLALSREWQRSRLGPHRAHRRSLAKGTPAYEQALAGELELERQAQAAYVAKIAMSDTPDQMLSLLNALKACVTSGTATTTLLQTLVDAAAASEQ